MPCSRYGCLFWLCRFRVGVKRPKQCEACLCLGPQDSLSLFRPAIIVAKPPMFFVEMARKGQEDLRTIVGIEDYKWSDLVICTNAGSTPSARTSKYSHSCFKDTLVKDTFPALRLLGCPGSIKAGNFLGNYTWGIRRQQHHDFHVSSSRLHTRIHHEQYSIVSLCCTKKCGWYVSEAWCWDRTRSCGTS